MSISNGHGQINPQGQIRRLVLFQVYYKTLDSMILPVGYYS